MPSLRAVLALLLVVASSIPSSVSAQRACVHETFDGGSLVFRSEYRFDARGRASVEEHMNDPAAFTTRTYFRYGADGLLRSVRVRVLEGPTRTGWDPPITVTYERTGSSLSERWESDQELNNRTAVWSFDERGLPVREEIDVGSTGETDEARVCAYDVLGRPVYTASGPPGRDASSETRWLWSDGQLSRVTRGWDAGEETLEVRRRGRHLELRSSDGVVERFTGDCEQVLFGMCSPALAPPGPSGVRRTVVSRRTRSVSRAATGPVSFAPASSDGPLDLQTLRRHYRGHVVFTGVTFGENDPSYPIPVVCVGPTLGDCLTSIYYDTDHRLLRVDSHDPSLSGPHGMRMGTPYAEAAPHLRDCVVERGIDEGIFCHVEGAPLVNVWLDGLEADPTHTQLGEPTAAMTAAARIVRFERVRER